MQNLVTKLALLIPFLFTPYLAAQDVAARKDADPPKQYDLRKVGGITPVKAQLGGTCWTHGTMAAIESNLLVSGSWKKIGAGKQLPYLSEYHLDWWNGFNQHTNDDLEDAKKNPSGLRVHLGGDYRVSAAYISRGDGVVNAPLKDDKLDTSWYATIPQRSHPEYKRYYVRDIEWFVMGDNLENIDTIKRRIIAEGAMGTAYAVTKGLMSKDFIHYQPKTNPSKPNHAVAIAGWDDEKVSSDPDKKTPKPGAWLIKNSWGTERTITKKDMDGKSTTVKVPVGEQGYYWISYYDKVCCRDPEMGAVSFRNVEPMKYHQVYFHDYHGWRATMKDIGKACNVFKATGKQDIGSLSFYTAADNVKYTASVYTKFDKGRLAGLKAAKSGEMRYTGFHTIDLGQTVRIEKDQTFIVCVELSQGGQAIDRTSEIEVLLQPEPKKPEPKKVEEKQPPKKEQPKAPRGPNGGPVVMSKANPGESYYFDGVSWRDLYEHRFENPTWATFDRSANFCMKALVVNVK